MGLFLCRKNNYKRGSDLFELIFKVLFVVRNCHFRCAALSRSREEAEAVDNMYSSAINAVVQTTLSQTISTTTYWAKTFANMYELKLLETIVASLSIFGSLTIIITYFIFEDLQTTTRKLLVYISFGDFFTVFPYLIEAWATYRHGTRNVDCEVQSFVSTTAVMWSFFWTSSLAIYLYIVIVRKNQELADKLMPYFHVVNWGLPLALNGVALGTGRLGTESSRDSGGWCWIKVDGSEKHMGRTIGWMLACGKLWEILSYFIDVILCFIVTRKINAEVCLHMIELLCRLCTH